MPEREDAGRDVVAALRDKYGDDDIAGDSPSFEILVARPRRNVTENSGDRSLTIPALVSLNEYDITSAGRLHELGSQICVVTELDLAKNRIVEWKEVYKLMCSFSNLQLLNVSFNPLRDICDEKPPKCPTLRRLVLNGTNVAHEMVDALLDSCPSLEELHLSLNEYTSIDLGGANQHTKLKILNFNSNDVTDWSQISKLGKKFPSLQSLTITMTKITTLGFYEENFPALKCLCLSNSAVSSWGEVEKLNSFPVLTEVRLKDIPLLQDYDEKLGRQLVLAHLPKISRLNGSRVSELEREDAERAAIRHYALHEEKPERYHHLVSKHGHLEQLVAVDLTPDETVNVRVVYNDRQTLMQVNVHWTVKEMKKRIGHWANVPLSKFILYGSDPRDSFGPNCLQHPNKVLYSMGITDGFEFEARDCIAK